MERITFWNGLHSIGSNIFSIENGTDRLIMDFGMPNEQCNNAQGMPITEALIAEKKLPAIPYLFDTRDFKRSLPGVHSSGYENQAVFISHLHLDHNAGLKYLPENTTVYMSEETKALYDALLACDMEVEVTADLRGVPYDTPVQIGHYNVTFIQNDHDVVGSSSILIEADDKRMLHSGDLRRHGYHPGNITVLIEKVKPLDLLMIEGTSFSFDDETDNQIQHTERDLLDEFTELLMDENRTIVINPYPRNIERMIALNNVANKLERPIHWDVKFSKLLKMYTAEEVRTWTTLDQLSDQVIQLHFDDYDLLSQLNSGVYLHMNGEPLGDYDPRYEVLMNKLEKHNFEFVDCSVSGHASKADILNVAEGMAPKVTVPWHTFEPEKQAESLQARGLKTLLPVLGETYLLDDLLER